jgi:hypothetical protein
VKFGVNKANCWRADILTGVKAITTNSHAEAIGLSFSRTHGTNKTGVSNLATGRDLPRFDEKHGVVATNLFADGSRFVEALSAATPFVGKRAGPDEGVRTT